MTEIEAGELLWSPTPESMAASRIGAFQRWLETSRGLTLTSYDDLWRWSVTDLDAFWMAVWDYFDVVASAQPSGALADAVMPGADWFPGARLNYAENMLRGEDGDLVVVAVSQTRERIDLTRGQLREQVARAAAGLRRLGVQRGDRVVAYLPNIPEAMIGMLACASIGAIWAACAPEVGTQSVLDRFQQLEPKVLLAIDGYRYGSKDIDRRDAVADLIAGLPTVTATVHVDYLNRPEGETPAQRLSWASLVAEAADPAYEQLPFSAPLWTLFSSGTTGLPKAIVHSHGGITLEQLKSSAFHADLGPGDRNFVFCTTSWVMWNISVCALLVGAAVVLMDGNPAFPDSGGLWAVVQDAGATSFGCGASFLVACLREGQRPGERFDLSRLRGVLSTGSPLPAAGFRWIYDAVNPAARLQSGSGGTDVCTGFVGGTPLHAVRAGEISCRNLGVLAEAFDASGHAVIGRTGELVISTPMPSMPIYFWNDPGDQRYRDAYFSMFPGRWRHGDWVEFSDSGACVISGRSDGTLNRGGVRLGTAEFYAVVEALPEVADSLVVHLEDPDGGSGRLILFLALTPGAELDDPLRHRVNSGLRTALSPRHVPDELHAVPDIPYNLTGKKLEVPVKRLLQGSSETDVVSEGSMRNPGSLAAFRALR